MKQRGFFDSLVEDFCRDLELKGAIEASRDKNGKADKRAATGMAFGLGHTSDDDIAMLGAMLGAEGAFDDDDIVDDFESFDDFDYISNSTLASDFNMNTNHYMDESEYEKKKKDIILNSKLSIIILTIAVVGILIYLIYDVGPESNMAKAIYIVSFAVLGLGTYYFRNQKEKYLQKLERDYEESKEIDAVNKDFGYEALRNYAGSDDALEVLNQLLEKAKYVVDETDKICNMEISSYDENMILCLVNSIIYFTINNCEITASEKANLFDMLCCKCDIKTDVTANDLFLVYNSDFEESMQNVLNVIYTMLTVASYKSGLYESNMDMTKTLCSLIILLGEKLDKKFASCDFGEKGICVILEMAQKSLKRVIDEDLLG